MTERRALQRTVSHPAIRHEQVQIVEGALSRLGEFREGLLSEAVERTEREFANARLDQILSEALHTERERMRRSRDGVFTWGRTKRDRVLWGSVQADLLRPAGEVDRAELLRRVVRHWAEEIGGHFDPRVYWLATRAVPWTFSWLLNAASVRRFLPWGMSESLRSRLHIVGEVPMIQRLAKRGTILLVPTHQSNIDSVLIGYVIYLMGLPPFAYGAGLNLFSNPALSFFMSNLGAYTVDRRKSHPLYKTALKHYSTLSLKRGVHSIFFPGGGRSRSGAVESKLKLGLLGTGLQAQLENMREGRSDPNVYVVPMVMSYNFVLEATSLIEDYLAEAGKHRFIIMDDDSWRQTQVLRFFWRLFSSQSGVVVRIGRALDVFGNFVDDEGRSIGPNGTTIDPVRWLTSRGELTSDPQRDHEYTRRLGARLSERFHRENTVLPSHLVAFSFFEALRKTYSDLDLYRFLRLNAAQRAMPLDNFLQEAERQHRALKEASDRGELHLSEELKTDDTQAWMKHGVRNLGILHDHAVVRVSEGTAWTDDMNLLYYYRNRLAGYGLSLLAGRRVGANAFYDEKGFLA